MLERQGSVAAVLLATISFAGLVVVLQLHPGDVRWPDLALLLFVTSGLLLVGCVQAIFWITKDEGPAANFARNSYNLGTLALIAGTAVLLVPGGDVSRTRSAAIVVAGLGFVGELGWVVYAVGRQRQGRAGVDDVELWIASIDPDLTAVQKRAVREWLETRGLDTGKKAHAAMQKRGEGPFGLGDLQGAGR